MVVGKFPDDNTRRASQKKAIQLNKLCEEFGNLQLCEANPVNGLAKVGVRGCVVGVCSRDTGGQNDHGAFGYAAPG
jgi:hypothetical protein